MSDVETRDVATQDVETQDRPRLRVMPPDHDVGPFFPSGISNVEAAIAQGVGPQPLQSSGELDAGQSAEAYDPSTETIDGVLAYVDKNPDQRDSVLEAERAGKNRSTLITQLEAR